MSVPIPISNPVVVPSVSSDTLDRWAIASFNLSVDNNTEVRDVTVRMVKSSSTKRSNAVGDTVEFRVANLLAEAASDPALLEIIIEMEPMLLSAAKILMDKRGLS